MQLEIQNPLLRRAFHYLEDGEWGKADDYCEQVLDQEPENALAYILKIMARLNSADVEELGRTTVQYSQWHSYRNAYRFADDALKTQLEQCVHSVQENIRLAEEKRLAEEQERARKALEAKVADFYNQGVRNSGSTATLYQLKEARRQFLNAAGYKLPAYADAEERAKACEQRIEEKEAEERSRRMEAYLAEKKRKTRITVLVSVIALLALILIAFAVRNMNESKKERAAQITQNLSWTTFYGTEKDLVFEGERLQVASEETQYDRIFTFNADGTVSVSTTKYYDEEPFIMRDGQRQWDSVQKYTDTLYWNSVKVAGNKVTVIIDGKNCELMVNSQNRPVSFVMDGVTYTAS